MVFDLNLSTILSGLILAAIVGVYQQLRKLNARMAAIEEWRIGKEKLDDERYKAQQEENDRLRIAVKA